MKTILMTGCSSGIGLDAAQTLSQRGWRVFASCRKVEDCARLQSAGLESPQIDYEDAASITRGMAEVLEATGGRLDALFNNGAYAIPGLVEDVPRAAMRAIFEANFFGWVDLTQRVLPVMHEQGQGRIVMTSSVLGYVASPWRGAYTASKFALEGITDTLRMELHGSGVHVSLIEPGPITARFRHNAADQYRKWITPAATRNPAIYQQLEDRYFDSLDHADKFELPASAVTAKLIAALESPRPKARYRVTTPAYAAAAMQRALPTRALDWVLRRS